MVPHRSTLLLVLLVIMPLALLAWLGTYLHQDGERRTKATRNSSLQERLQVADHQLSSELKQVVRQLDHLTEDAAASSAKCAPLEHAWIIASICFGPDQEPLTNGDPEQAELLTRVMSAFKSQLAQTAERGGQPDQSFELLSSKLFQGWKAYRLAQNLSSWQDQMTPAMRESGLLIQDQLPGLPQLMHWHQLRDGRLTGALLDSAAVCGALFAALPHSGLKLPPGQMRLSSDLGGLLHSWGLMDEQTSNRAEARLDCSIPFSSWTLSYTPAPDEFPPAMLFPILLGVTSGSLLVPSLAWLYFRESNREIRVAHQRVSFVNQVSHELKTPLTNIRLYAEMARARAEHREDPAAVRQLIVVETETARLNRLIQNVLNFARKQRDRLTVMTKRVNLADVIARVTEQWRPVLEKRGLALEVTAAPDMPVQTDPDAVEQILGNLLSNAEKYAAEGRWVRVEAGAGDPLQVSIQDNGPGIPPSKQEQIFEPFERLRSDLREGVSGTGIGLTISRELAQQLGGKLMVDPACRKGARFILTLPALSTPQTLTTSTT